MSKDSEKKDENFLLDAEVAYSKAEHWIEKNKTTLTAVVTGLVVIVLGYFAWTKWYIAGQEEEAAGQMFMAEVYFEKDSFQLALEGDANYPGFRSIIEDYPFTKQSNLAKYYAGICQLNLGEYDEAIAFLEDFDSDDPLIAPIAIGGIGDAYVEKGETESAVKYFLQAAEVGNNKFISPVYLMKAALAYEDLRKFEEAIKVYERIKKEFYESTEARDIDKYIARAQNS